MIENRMLLQSSIKTMFLSENLQDKWSPILEHSDLPKIEDNYKRAVTAVILENQEKASQTSLSSK